MIREEDIIRLINAAHGRAEAIHAHEIAAALKLKRSAEREIRRAISRMDQEGTFPFLLGRISGGGFFRLSDYEEGEAMVKWFDQYAEKAVRKADHVRASCARHGLYIPGGRPSARKADAAGQLKDVVAQLIAAQAALREDKATRAEASDKRFAKRIGVARITWAQLKAGKYQSSGGRNLVAKLQAGLSQINKNKTHKE